MKDFNDYKIANITDQENKEINELENKMKTQDGKDVVLIAYQECK